MKPTDDQITAEIKALQDLSERLPLARRNLSVVIRALEDRMSFNAVYDAYDSEDTQFPYALSAAMWLSGADHEPPSKGWE